MVLAGGVLLAGCSSGGDTLGKGGTGGGGGAGGASGTGGSTAPDGGRGGGNGGSVGGVGGSPGTAGGQTGSAGGSAGSGGGTPGTGGLGFPCGNASPDPCICGRPDASSSAAEACAAVTACREAGGTWSPGTGDWGKNGQCKNDGGVLSLDGAADMVDGDSHD